MTAVLAMLCAAILVVADQLTKYLITSNFTVGESMTVVDGVLNFTYVQNDGAVFGSLSGKGYIFNTVTVIVVIVGIALIALRVIKPKLLVWAASLIISGGVGNLIDRFRLGYVVDFIDVRCFGELWKWVFNIADCCVVIGCLIVIAYYVADSVREYRKGKTQAAASEECDNADA